MSRKVNFLRKDKKYFFCVLYGFDVESVQKLNFKAFGIRTIKLFSTDFDKLSSEIDNLYFMIKDDLDLFKFYHAHDLSLLLFSENEESINKFHDLLSLLRPSKIQRWLTFDTYYVKVKMPGSNGSHHTNGYSIWTPISHLYDQLEIDDIFYLTNNDIIFVNKLIPKYDSLSKNASFIKFIHLYRRLYYEETNYFKYLLLFMAIESLIIDDETTGVVYKVRRLCAILIGSTTAECQMIFDKVRDAYTVRSKLVHSAKNELSKGKYLTFMHSIVCELGITILISNLNTDNIFKLSNTLGFAQKRTLVSERLLRGHTCMRKNWLNFHTPLKN